MKNVAFCTKFNTYLMISKVIVASKNEQSMEARAVINTGSTASYITESLATALQVSHRKELIRILGIAGSQLDLLITHGATFKVSFALKDGGHIEVEVT